MIVRWPCVYDNIYIYIYSLSEEHFGERFWVHAHVIINYK